MKKKNVDMKSTYSSKQIGTLSQVVSLNNSDTKFEVYEKKKFCSWNDLVRSHGTRHMLLKSKWKDVHSVFGKCWSFFKNFSLQADSRKYY